MRKTLAEIAELVGGRVAGDGAVVITGISGIKEAHEGDLTFLANPKYLSLVHTTRASAVIVGPDVVIEGKPVIVTDNPSLSFVKVVELIKANLTPRITGVHPTAVVSPDAVIGEDVGIGPYVVIGSGAVIGRGTVICAGVFIGDKTSVGEDCLIYPNVTLREDITVSDRVIIHSGSVIGSDGFGYIASGDTHIKVPQMGTVTVGSDVEIGSCVTIDRARFDRTVIGAGTKIDNLVQIAHNVRIGENCLIIALAGIAGSATIGNNVIIAGQVGVAGHITVGDRVVAAAQAGVAKNIPAGMMVSGYPAEEHKKAARILGHVHRLPHYVEELFTLREKMRILEEKLECLEKNAC
jgi:UDP-3-O-[3-hydroxymyristoyl] glucosamine N-acyltransferase